MRIHQLKDKDWQSEFKTMTQTYTNLIIILKEIHFNMMIKQMEIYIYIYISNIIKRKKEWPYRFQVKQTLKQRKLSQTGRNIMQSQRADSPRRDYNPECVCTKEKVRNTWNKKVLN